ncbi:type III secretion system outer membrane ring subunit SctC [Janthinobacterium agaricidamnosum]|uniref:Type 3 secretion system secretin n=1 Tax=Janthinobacterium agaricidamnosum NBRC 102515 = DSM 9628 TaxID=1349767 RepID=W0V4Y4_9BURK|nr:type III secretion system outer membrane ring subunit SctC [Janthinobacterium agaricidamnosum]CDG82332.1 conserved hypothetical protein [Janthinobacterium agaricidamnosum NBRC 102515 = DSM 9628]
MNHSHFSSWRRALLLAASLAVPLMTALPAAASTPANWKDTAYSVDANGMGLEKVLAEFATAYGVRVESSLTEASRVKGRIKADSGSDFLDRLGATQHFRWFVYNATLYIVPDGDYTTARLNIGEAAVPDAKPALVGLGLFDSRFGWGELPEDGAVIVSGPRPYVELARKLLTPTAKEKGVAPQDKQIMVFRLKYANATDRTIDRRGQKETIPGLKTILSGMINNDTQARTEAPAERVAKSPYQKLGMLPAENPDPGLAPAAQPRNKGGEQKQRIRIDADPTLNALIVYDLPEKRDMYRALLDELDVEPRQIEIEALIIDIDRDKLAELGVEWSVTSGNTTTTVNGTGANSNGTDTPLPGSTLLINNLGRFYARLHALEGSGEAHVLAKPTIMTLDNVPAVLDLSQTAYVPLVGERVADLANISVGTLLRVVPRLVHDGSAQRVHLEVDVEDGSLGDSSNNANTKVTRSNISTQAIINLQQTLMIGGYHAEKLNRQNQKVPLLGDLPLIGGMFRSSSDSQSSRERLFLITPRLTGDGIAATPQSSVQVQANTLLAAAAAQVPAGLAPALAAPGAIAAKPPRARCKGRRSVGNAQLNSYLDMVRSNR